MPTQWSVYACLAIGLHAALVGGVFQAFSDFVMRGLMEATPSAGVAGMQGINRTVLKSYFLTAFLVLVPGTVAMGIFALQALEGPAQRFVLIGTLSYAVLVFGVTVFGNVPMNDRLAKLPAMAAEAADYWEVYGKVWTGLNHLRTIGSTVTAGSYLLAMLILTQKGIV